MIVCGRIVCGRQAKWGRRFDIPAAQVTAFLALSLVTGWAQTAGPGQTPPSVMQGHPLADAPSDDPPQRFTDSMRAKRNEDRQKRLTSDAQRLLLLANQLKNEIASSGAETMTPEMLRQIEEIEHLARSVKDKMRN